VHAILGVDGGGTHTRASIVLDGRVLAHSVNGSIKRLRVGAEDAEHNFRALLKDVYGQARLTAVHAASVGVASATSPGTVEWITSVLKDFGVERSEVVGDEVIALDAAFHGGPGILQIAGTGSNTIGRAVDGSRECAGGYSSRLGDEGSGYWIGVNSVRRALHAYDREEPTQILAKVGEIWGTHSLEDLVSLGNSTPGPDFAALAPAINELAEAGDAVALGVLKQAATDLVGFVLLVRRKLRARHAIAGEVPVAWTGGAVEKMTLVREAFFAGLHAAAPEMPVAKEAAVPLEGALWRAKRLAGKSN
jgi:glucosamine kinase